MTIEQISFTSEKIPEKGSLMLLSGKNIRGASLRKLDKLSGGQISRALKAASFKGGKGESAQILAPSGLSLSHIIIAGLGVDDESEDEGVRGFRFWLELGGAMCAMAGGGENGEISLLLENQGESVNIGADEIAAIAAGFRLRSYRFDKYSKGKKKIGKNGEGGKKDAGGKIKKLIIACKSHEKAGKAFDRLNKIVDGVFLARDLVNEPANMLGPEEFAQKALELESMGVETSIIDEKEMAALGMNAMLAVGRGSARPPRLAVMRWNGSGGKEKPLVMIGKGLCFDSGGISIKPAAGMEDMKGDMGGAACVIGLMKALAGRGAKTNVVGVIALAENMPGGRATRPGDVVKSMSGQTIEVINTDAEGRLVLADAITYASKEFKPRLIIDLATLTGAIIVALGKEHAGLFANNDRLASKLLRAGENVGEKLWRMPLGKAYDKMIESRIADMKNIGGRHAGAITAAQFLQRFIKDDAPWAHIDIAGAAMGSPASDVNQSWGSGFGVMLLNEFIAANYEKKS
jgi:leucyl aminopeptidase